MRNEQRLLPWLTIAVEQYNRMLRILDKGITVKVASHVAVQWWPEEAPGNGFNTLAKPPARISKKRSCFSVRTSQCESIAS